MSRIEDASLNASAPRQQRWLDGWLVRLCPGKAQRARSIQAVASGRTTVADKLAACRPIYDEAGLPLVVRVTPFSLPAGLDDELERCGLVRLDETRVMVNADLATMAPMQRPVPGAQLRFAVAEPEPFADWVGATRGSSAAERMAHARRLGEAPVPLHLVFARDAAGHVVAAGHVAMEGEIAGLYDIVTAEGQRRQGVGAWLCGHLLELAVARGAQVAYLQVHAGNEPARQLYRRLHFTDAYAYHYRALPA